MCLGGNAMPTYQPPKKRIVEPGPASPDDMLDGQVIENANDRSQQQALRDANRGPTATAQQSRAPTKRTTDKAY